MLYSVRSSIYKSRRMKSLSAKAGNASIGFLEEAFGAAEVAGGADIGEGEVEAVGVLVADGAELVLAVLDGEAAAVPVVVGLDGGVLDLAEVDVDAGVGGDGEAGAVGVAEAAERRASAGSSRWAS